MGKRRTKPRRPGRPPRSRSGKGVRVTVRLSPAELDYLRRRCRGKTLSDRLRSLIPAGSVKVHFETQEDYDKFQGQVLGMKLPEEAREVWYKPLLAPDCVD